MNSKRFKVFMFTLMIITIIQCKNNDFFAGHSVDDYNSDGNSTFFKEFKLCTDNFNEQTLNVTYCCNNEGCYNDWFDDKIIESRTPLCKDNNNLDITWPDYDNCILTPDYMQAYHLVHTNEGNVTDLNCFCYMKLNYKFIHRVNTTRALCNLEEHHYCLVKSLIEDNLNVNSISNRRSVCSLSCTTYKEYLDCSVCGNTYITSESGKLLCDSQTNDKFQVHLENQQCEYTICLIENIYEGSSQTHCFEYNCNQDCKSASWVYLLTFSRLDCFSKISIVTFSILFVIVVLVSSYILLRLINYCCHCLPKFDFRITKYLKLHKVNDNNSSNNDSQNEIGMQLIKKDYVIKYNGVEYSKDELDNLKLTLEQEGVIDIYTNTDFTDDTSYYEINKITPKMDTDKSLFVTYSKSIKNLFEKLNFMSSKIYYLRAAIPNGVINKIKLSLLFTLLLGGSSVEAQMCTNLGSLSSTSVNCVNSVCNLVTDQLIIIRPDGRSCFEYYDNNNKLLYKLVIEIGKSRKIYELVPQYWTPLKPTTECRDNTDYHSGGRYPGAVAPFNAGVSISKSHLGKYDGGVEDMCYGHPTGRWHNVDNQSGMFYISDLNDGKGRCKDSCGTGYDGYCKAGFLHYYQCNSCGISAAFGTCYDCYWSYHLTPTNEKIDVYKPLLKDVISDWKITEIFPDMEPISNTYTVTKDTTINLKIGDLRVASLSSFDNDNSFYGFYQNNLYRLEYASDLNHPQVNTIGWWQCKPGTNCKGRGNMIYDYSIWGNGHGKCSGSLISQSSSCSFDQVLFSWSKYKLPLTFNNHFLERYYDANDEKFYVIDTPGNLEQTNNELFVQLNGTYTIHKLIDTPHVTSLEISCENLRGNNNDNSLTYKCLSDLGVCDLNSVDGGSITILDYLKCDGKSHKISSFYHPINEKQLICGDFNFGLLKCTEILDISLRLDNLTITYNETTHSFMDGIKDGFNLDLNFGSMSIWDKIKSIVIIIIEVGLIILIIGALLYCCGPPLLKALVKLPKKFTNRFKPLVNGDTNNAANELVKQDNTSDVTSDVDDSNNSVLI